MEEPFSLEIQSPEIVKVSKPRKPRKPRQPRAPRVPRKLRVKKLKKVKKVSRRVIVARFVDIPKNAKGEFWQKELTIIRQL